jgi:hypothetical protein
MFYQILFDTHIDQKLRLPNLENLPVQKPINLFECFRPEYVNLDQKGNVKRKKNGKV